MSQLKKTVILVTDLGTGKSSCYSTLSTFLDKPEGAGYSRDTIVNHIAREKKAYSDGKIELTRLPILYKEKKE